jgi:molecular chaperone DnaJ
MSASLAEIKQAYRRLAKEYHPDRNSASDASDRIVAINAAYEILGDQGQRQRYDRDYAYHFRRSRSTSRNQHVAEPRSTRPAQSSRADRGSASDERLQRWIEQVYRPIDRQVARILHSLDRQIDELSADPFDDALMDVFCNYIETSKEVLDGAQQVFRSQPNPSTLASVAADVYCYLDRVSDGLEELEYFTLNYDDRHLHMGQELFRIAIGLRANAFQGLRNFSC